MPNSLIMTNIDFIKNHHEQLLQMSEPISVLYNIGSHLPDDNLSGIASKYFEKALLNYTTSRCFTLQFLGEGSAQKCLVNYLIKCSAKDFQHSLTFGLRCIDSIGDAKQPITNMLFAALAMRSDTKSLKSFLKHTKGSDYNHILHQYWTEFDEDKIIRGIDLLGKIDVRPWLLNIIYYQPIEQQERIFKVYQRYHKSDGILHLRAADIIANIERYQPNQSSFVNGQFYALEGIKALGYMPIPDLIEPLRRQNHLYDTICQVESDAKALNIYLRVLYMDKDYISKTFYGETFKNFKEFKAFSLLGAVERVIASYKSTAPMMKIPTARSQKKILDKKISANTARSTKFKI